MVLIPRRQRNERGGNALRREWAGRRGCHERNRCSNIEIALCNDICMSPTNQSHTYKIPLWVYDSVAFHSHVYVWASRRCTNDQDPELTGWEITLPKRCWVQDMLPAPLMWLAASCLLCGCNCSSGLWFQTLPPWERRTHTCTTLGFCPAGQSPHFQQLLMLLPVAGQTSKGGSDWPWS